MMYHMVFIKSVIIFCLFNLTLLLTKDPAIEWNPGPGNYKKIIYIYIRLREKVIPVLKIY